VAIVQTNVFDRASDLGTNLIIDHLLGYKTVASVTRELNENGFKTTTHNARKILDRYKENFDKRPQAVGFQLITHRMVQTRILEIQAEFKKAMVQDPVLVLHKNILELENMKEGVLGIRDQGSILDLQSKLAEKLAKLQPPDIVKININELLKRNDLGVNFIIQIDSKYPGLKIKDKFLDFVRSNGGIED
jgi:hypothetical protein